MPRKGGNKVPGHKDIAKKTDLTYPGRPRLLNGLRKADTVNYQDVLRKRLFETAGEENVDWAPHNPNTPHTTRHFWIMTDLKGIKRKCCREMFHEISAHDEESFTKNPIVKRVTELVDKQMGANPTRAQPPDTLIRFTMAKLALSKTKASGKYKGLTHLEAHRRALNDRKLTTKREGRTPFIGPVFQEALAQLWRHSERWPDVQREYDARSPSLNEALEFINKCMGKRKSNTLCEAYDRDEVASADETILGEISRDIIYIAVDKHNTGILLRWPKCVQHFFDETVTTKAVEDVRTYHSIEPSMEPDYHRSPTDRYWGEQNPWFDKANNAQYPGAMRGVTYLGFGCETGHPHEPVAAKTASKKGPAEVAKLRKDMLEGSLDVISEAQRFLLGLMNPELLAKQQAAIRKFPVATMIPPNGAHSYTSILDCVKSDSHRDSKDAEFGYASLTALGDFEGGDLIFRDQGLRLSFEDGDVAVFMGHEMIHGITWWTGTRRICIVNAFHQDIWRQEDWAIDENGVKGPAKKRASNTKQPIQPAPSEALDNDKGSVDTGDDTGDHRTNEAESDKEIFEEEVRPQTDRQIIQELQSQLQMLQSQQVQTLQSQIQVLQSQVQTLQTEARAKRPLEEDVVDTPSKRNKK